MALGDLSVQILLLDALFAVAMLVLGAGAGWLLSPRGARSAENDQAQHALDKLRELASTMAADVDEHAHRMQVINDELTEAQSGDEPGSACVVNTVTDIIKANEELQARLATAEVKLQRQEEELQIHLAASRTDALTGACNRRAFDDELARRLAEWTRRHTVFSLVMLDVDYFKKFNDTHGHQAGDEVLKGVARVLRDTMREMDFVARYGGEEFACVLPVTNQKEAMIAGERIRYAIEQAVFAHDGTELRVTTSLGVAQVRSNDNAAEIIRRADAALYHSKSAGRNCVHGHDGEACRPASEFLPQPVASPVAGDNSESAEPKIVVAGPARVTAPVASNPEEAESGFHADLRRRVVEARKFHVPLSLMMIEIDKFSDLSDSFGVAVSDMVYDTLGDFIRLVMQEMDVASRRGDGQFAVMLPGTDLESAVTVAERLRAAVENHTLQVKGTPLNLTLSAGVAEIHENDDTTTLTKRASAALFASRNGGRNCTYLHDGEKCESATQALAAC